MAVSLFARPVIEGQGMTPIQLRAAREMLGLSHEHVAAMADVSVTTITGYEGETQTVPTSVIESIQVALEAAGVEFLQAPDGPPVRLRRGASA